MSDSIKVKIRKMLEMTEDRGCTEAEASVAIEKAQRLLEEHDLSMTDVVGVEEKKDFTEKGDFLAFAWAKKVAASVAQLYDCEYVCEGNQRAAKGNHFRVRFVGRQSNAETSSLITEFIVKTILKLSRREQKERGEGNRFATDFAHGCADRVCDRAFDLWKDANAEAIAAAELAATEKRRRQEEMMLDPRNLLPGTYRVELCNRDYCIRKVEDLDHIKAMMLFHKTMAEPPRGIYLIYLRCLEGEMASEFEYGWRCQEDNRRPGRGRQLVKDEGTYDLGSQAGDDIGLHVQVSSAATSNQVEN